MHSQNSLWVKLFQSNYKWGVNVVPCLDGRRTGSNLCQGVKAYWPLLENNIAWKVNNGHFVAFWKDVWVSNTDRLRLLVDGASAITQVGTFINENKVWDLQSLIGTLPDLVLDRIQAIPTPRDEYGDDVIVWHDSTEGNFSLKQAYLAITATVDSVNCDAIVQMNGKATCGGLVRGDDAHFICGFATYVGICHITHAELWDIYSGLKISLDQGFLSIIIENGSKLAIDLINFGCLESHSSYNLIKQIKDLANAKK
ncbi:hypothetical protein VNO78_08560 [Psophocarpus tetragonolobus]|uniref:RNase H type-1 domain-containing protein n=1 Tax=Psophocarpus tetragonolobus TaxID=3891 RepID=A0AAN9SV16_PSOTE